MIQTTLSKCTQSMGVSLSDEMLNQFKTYSDMLVSWNEKMNLTAITEPFDIASKHFVDSLAGLKFIKDAKNLIDVGTGAGFPGIPLKIACPTLSLTLLDSLAKRLKFLDAVVDELNLENVKTIHSRAEDGAKYGEALRESFDISVSRAVSRLNVLSEYCLPYVKVGGVFLAYKGSDVTEEANESLNAVKLLGGEISDIYTYPIPLTDITHSIVVIQKIKETPDKYPRLQGKISKQPL
ncbi:MAG: 16S rRNA (guanine(527)-N(7))-methyltransferase RsmG [Clostridia bacterium]|nr:16S rRNA (guanine(527)-N(7))-methyltransferase RsmG [Clostridia bacterium]